MKTCIEKRGLSSLHPPSPFNKHNKTVNKFLGCTQIIIIIIITIIITITTVGTPHHITTNQSIHHNKHKREQISVKHKLAYIIETSNNNLNNILRACDINIIRNTVKTTSKWPHRSHSTAGLDVSNIKCPHLTAHFKLHNNYTPLPKIPPHPPLPTTTAITASPQVTVLTLSWIFGSAPFSRRYLATSKYFILQATLRGVHPCYIHHRTKNTKTTIRHTTSYHDKSINPSPQTHKTTTIHAHTTTSNTIWHKLTTPVTII
jgi:hypothetical protein